MTVKLRLQHRHDTAANWTSANPTLRAGEMGFETDTLKFKIGDGTTAWTSLAYAGGGGGSSLPDPVTVAHGGTGATTTSGARAALGAVSLAGDTMTGALVVPNNVSTDPTGRAVNTATLQTIVKSGHVYDLQRDFWTSTSFPGDHTDVGAAWNSFQATLVAGDSVILPVALATTIPLNVLDLDGVTIRGRSGGTGRADDGVGSSGTRVEVLSGFTGGPTTVTVAAASNAVDVSTWTSAAPGTLFVSSTAGFPSADRLYVATAAGLATIDYFGKTAGATPAFVGCTYFNGSGSGSTLSTGGAVDGAVYALNVKRSAEDRPLAGVHIADLIIDGALSTGTFSWNGASRIGTRVTRTGALPISGLRINSYRSRIENVYIRKMSGRGLTYRGYDNTAATTWVSGTSYVVGNQVRDTVDSNNYLCISATSGTTAPHSDATHWLVMSGGPDSFSWHTYDSYVLNPDIGFCGEEGLTLHVGGVDVQGSGGNIYQNLINFHAADEAACQWTNAQFYSSVWQNLLFDNGGSRSQFSSMKIEESGREAIKIDTNRRGVVNIQFDGGRIKNGSMESDNGYDTVAIVGPSNKGATRTTFNGVTFAFDSGAGSNKAKSFINCGTSSQKTQIHGCIFGDGLQVANTHLSSSGSGIPLVDTNATTGNAAQARGNIGIPENATFVARRTANGTGNVTLSINDDYFAFTGLTASRTVTLPSPTGQPGAKVTIKDESGLCSATVTITIVGTIDGATNKVLTAAYAAATIQSDGTNWFTLDGVGAVAAINGGSA